MYEDWNTMDDATKERLGDFAVNLVMGAVMHPEVARRFAEDAQQDLNPDDETPQYIPVVQQAAPIVPVQVAPTGIIQTSGADIVSALDEEVSDLYSDYEDYGDPEDFSSEAETEAEANIVNVPGYVDNTVANVGSEPTSIVNVGPTGVVSNRDKTTRRRRRTSHVADIIMKSLAEDNNPNGGLDMTGSYVSPTMRYPATPVNSRFGNNNNGAGLDVVGSNGQVIGSMSPNNGAGFGGVDNMAPASVVPEYGSNTGNSFDVVGNNGQVIGSMSPGGSNTGVNNGAGFGEVNNVPPNNGAGFGGVNNTAPGNMGAGFDVVGNNGQVIGNMSPGPVSSNSGVASSAQEAPGIFGQSGFGGVPLGAKQQQNVQSIDPDMAQQPNQAVYANRVFMNATRKSDERNYVNPMNAGSVFENVKRTLTPDEKRTSWADIHYEPQAGRTTVDGKSFEFKFIQKNVPWGSEFTDNFEHNFLLMKKRITESVRTEFGGFGRIREIVVQDSRLFINRIMYCPMIEPACISRLPQDLQSAMMNGNIAEFFDWSALKHMRSLYSLSIDTPYFYCTTVLDDLGVSRRGGVSTVFKCVPSLEQFSLGGETITRNNLGTPQSHEIKEKVRKQKKNIAIMDGFKLNVYGGGDYLQETCWASTKSYIENRGNKNIFRFCGGLLLRGTTSAAVTAGNAFVHTVGWGFKTIGNMLKAGMEPIDGSEHFTQ